MITRFKDREKAYKDREYWFKQGYSVAVLLPGEGDEFYTVYVAPPERRLKVMSKKTVVLGTVLGVVMWIGMIALVLFLWKWIVL